MCAQGAWAPGLGPWSGTEVGAVGWDGDWVCRRRLGLAAGTEAGAGVGTGVLGWGWDSAACNWVD